MCAQEARCYEKTHARTKTGRRNESQRDLHVSLALVHPPRLERLSAIHASAQQIAHLQATRREKRSVPRHDDGSTTRPLPSKLALWPVHRGTALRVFARGRVWDDEERAPAPPLLMGRPPLESSERESGCCRWPQKHFSFVLLLLPSDLFALARVQGPAPRYRYCNIERLNASRAPAPKTRQAP